MHKTEIGRRLRAFRESLNVRQSDFAESIGLKQGSYSDIERGKISLSSTVIRNIVKNYKLNINWVFTGEGNMTTIKDCASIVQSTPNHVHLMPDHVHLIEQKRSKNILVPIKAQAGYAESLDQERLPEELEYVHVPGVTGEARTFEIEGESMEPVLFSGDYVVSVRVEDFKDIKNDRIYIVVCRLSSIYIKYTKIKGSQMLLISENSDRFATEAVHLSDIKEVWEARIKITTNFDPVMSKEEQNRQGLRITSIEQFLSQKFPGWPPK